MWTGPASLPSRQAFLYKSRWAALPSGRALPSRSWPAGSRRCTRWLFPQCFDDLFSMRMAPPRGLARARQGRRSAADVEAKPLRRRCSARNSPPLFRRGSPRQESGSTRRYSHFPACKGVQVEQGAILFCIMYKELVRPGSEAWTGTPLRHITARP